MQGTVNSEKITDYTANNTTITRGIGKEATNLAATTSIINGITMPATSLSDTDTESGPIIIKRPILIRGDVEFLKNFPAVSFTNECAYYSTDNRTVEVKIFFQLSFKELAFKTKFF